MIPQRFSPWSFVALRGPSVAKVFFVVLRGPSWIKKGVLPRPSWTDQFMIPQRFSPWSFLRGHKRCSPPPFVDRPNHDPAKVFFVVLRGPSWIQKRCSPPPFVDRPNHDPAKVFFVALHRKKGVLPRPSWTDQFMIPQRFSSWSFVALRGSKKVFSPALRGQTRILSCSSQFR